MSPVLYLHGFASGPQSYKGMAFDEHLTARGVRVRRLDLRLPDRNRLRLSAMVEHTGQAADEHGDVVIVGSSLGGLVAAHVASHHPAVRGCVLMAPAFGFAERWARSFGPDGLARWRGGTPLRVPDHAGGPPLAVDYGFYEDVERVEREWRSEPSQDLRTPPVLVFHGVRDQTVDIASSHAFARDRAHVRLVELDDEHTLIGSLPRMLTEATEFIEGLLRDA